MPDAPGFVLAGKPPGPGPAPKSPRGPPGPQYTIPTVRSRAAAIAFAPAYGIVSSDRHTRASHTGAATWNLPPHDPLILPPQPLAEYWGSSSYYRRPGQPADLLVYLSPSNSSLRMSARWAPPRMSGPQLQRGAGHRDLYSSVGFPCSSPGEVAVVAVVPAAGAGTATLRREASVSCEWCSPCPSPSTARDGLAWRLYLAQDAPCGSRAEQARPALVDAFSVSARLRLGLAFYLAAGAAHPRWRSSHHPGDAAGMGRVLVAAIASGLRPSP